MKFESEKILYASSKEAKFLSIEYIKLEEEQKRTKIVLISDQTSALRVHIIFRELELLNTTTTHMRAARAT